MPGQISRDCSSPFLVSPASASICITPWAHDDERGWAMCGITSRIPNKAGQKQLNFCRFLAVSGHEGSAAAQIGIFYAKQHTYMGRGRSQALPGWVSLSVDP